MGVSHLTMQLVAFIPSAFIILIGLINNIVILATIIKNRKKNTKASVYYFIGSLVLYDILTLTLYWPVQLIKLFAFWPFGLFLCYFCNSFSILFSAATAITMIVMVVDIYRVILKDSNANPKTFRKILVLMVIFIAAFGLSSPCIIYTKYKAFAYGKVLCYISFPGNKLTMAQSWLIYYLTGYIIVYILPTITTLALFCKIWYNLSKESANISSSQGLIGSQKKMIKLLLILTSVFFILSTPEYIWYFIYYYQLLHNNSIINYQLLKLIFQLISLSKSVINSVIYACFVPEGKQILQRIYCIGYIRRSITK